MVDYLVGECDVLEDCRGGGAVVVPVMASVCLALLEYVVANRWLGELDLLLDLKYHSIY